MQSRVLQVNADIAAGNLIDGESFFSELDSGPHDQSSLIQWLKGLGNTTTVPPMAHHDFNWMWEELGLECRIDE